MQRKIIWVSAVLALGCASTNSRRPAASPSTEPYPESSYVAPEPVDAPPPASSQIPDKRTQAGSDAAQDERIMGNKASTAPDKAPVDQGRDDADVRTSREIREQIMADNSLSFDARNIDIQTEGGRVTLRGAVKSAKESSQIERLARGTMGVHEVNNQLVVAP